MQSVSVGRQTARQKERSGDVVIPPPKVDKDVVAIAVADLHLCHTPPPARCNEPDWYGAMQRPLDEIHTLWAKYKAPILYAGDIFDAPKPPLELVNWALEYLPPGFGVPGNHDLPHHSYEEIKKSAYWNLCLNGKIRNIEPGKPMFRNDLVLHGFPCNSPVTPCTEPIKDFALQVAVVHSYVWRKGCGYQDAKEEDYFGSYKEKLKGYEVVIFGDNHIHFQKGNIWNCGGMMRRRIDQKDYQPCVGLIRANGEVTKYELDCSKDIITEMERMEKGTLDLSGFTEGVTRLKDTPLDFKEAVHKGLKEIPVSKGAKKIVLGCLERTRK